VLSSLTQRLLAALCLLFALSVAGFGMLQLLPGDYVSVLMTAQSEGIPPTPEEVAAYAALHGLDRPLPLQYIAWLGDLMRGELGQSFAEGRPVADMLGAAAWNSALLTGCVMVVAVALALPMAIFAALHPNSLADRVLTLFSVAGMSIPTFWYALLASLLFVLYLRWLPSSGFSTPLHIVLPTLVAATGIAGFLARYLRGLLLEEMQRPHVLNARAQGHSALGALVFHALPNALPQILTVLGTQIIHVFEGMLIIETIFNWPGMGRLFVSALMSRDFPVIQACFLTIGAAYVVINLVVDLVIGHLDRQTRGAI